MAVSSALISLKHDLHLLINSHAHLSPPSISREDRLQILLEKVDLITTFFRDILKLVEFCRHCLEIVPGIELQKIQTLIFSLKKRLDFQASSHDEEFRNMYKEIRSLDLECINYSLKRCSIHQPWVREVVFSLKKELEFLCHKDHLHNLHQNVLLMDSLLKDSSGENYDPRMMSPFHDRIQNVTLKATNFIYSEPLEDVWVQFDQFDWSQFRFRHRKPMMEGVEQSLPKITQEIIDINEELKIHNDRSTAKQGAGESRYDYRMLPANIYCGGTTFASKS